jgi:hypothetical protein
LLDHAERAKACLDLGLTWITERLDLFVPEDPCEPEQIKETAELSILCGALTEWSLDLPPRSLGSIHAHLVNFLSDPKLAEWVRKLPSFYSPYIVAYLPLRAVGVRIPTLEAALPKLHGRGYPAALETTPYRELELRYLVWKAGLSRRPPTHGTVHRRSSLYRCRNPIYFSMDEVYSVTHTLFYLTDFVGGDCGLSASEKSRATAVVEALLAHYVRKFDWDMTSELLLNMVGLECSRTPLFSAAFQAVSKAWRSDGALPGPAFSSLAEDATRKQIFQRCYHTTLVGLLMCGAYLHCKGKSGDQKQVSHVTA